MPMSRPLRVLVVAQATSFANLLISWLTPESYEPVVARTFAAAKIHLDMEPDLLVTELRLGEFNGLHLALRAHSKSVPAIVIGDSDPVLERDSRELGAVFLQTADLRREEFLRLVDSALITAAAAESQNRTHIAWLDESSTAVLAGDPHATPLIRAYTALPGTR